MGSKLLSGEAELLLLINLIKPLWLHFA